MLSLSSQWLCVPFVLMNPHTMDIGRTLMNNTVHASWMGKLELKKIWIIIDDFLLLVRKCPRPTKAQNILILNQFSEQRRENRQKEGRYL